jgi:glycosyltransferase involved in cell wall biosynthesis
MNKISVLNISSGDLVGSRFNGYDWHYDLEELGAETKMLVGWNHDSKVNWVQPISDRKQDGLLRSRDRVIFNRSLKAGRESANFPWSSKVFDHPWYKAADLVHLQIIHDGTLDFRAIKRVIDEKPTVWTWHDPWPLTGHCIYPMDCTKWEGGCGGCPDLDRAFTIAKDRTREIRIEKKEVINKKFTLHVASNWFADFINSDSRSNPPIPTVLPFGLKQNWAGSLKKESARKLLGIHEQNFVIGFRNVDEPQKNVELVRSAMRILPTNSKITFLTIQNTGTLEEFKNKFEIVEIPWTNDNSLINQFFSSLDLFLMPSRWETFGFMALEAMSYGVPVVGLKSTATSEICHLQENGYLLSDNTGYALTEAIKQAFEHEFERRERGERSLNYVVNNRNYNTFLNELVGVYRKTIKDFSSE